MSVKLIENKILLVLNGLLLFVPCIFAEGSGTGSDDCNEAGDYFLRPNDCELDSSEGGLAIGVYVIIALIVVLTFVLLCCCWCYCRTRKAAVRKQQVTFTDPEEGNVELMNVKEKDDDKDDEEKAEQGEDKPPGGEESKEAVEQITNEDNVTSSTFGHTKDKNVEKVSDAKKEGEAKSVGETETDDKGPSTTDGGDVISKETGHKSVESIDNEAVDEESSHKKASESSEDKQKANASKTVEAAEQTQGQTKIVEGTSLQPVPVSIPIFNLTQILAKSEPPSLDTPVSTEETTKESSDMEVVSESSNSPVKKSDEAAKDEKEPEAPSKPAESSLKPVAMGFEDIEEALGLALKGLGDF